MVDETKPTTDTIAEGGGEQSRPNLQEINEQPGQTDDLEARRAAANRSDRYSAEDLRYEDGELRARDQALKREAAAGTPYDPSDLSVEDGEVTAPEPTERVDVTLFDPGEGDPAGDVTIVGPDGERRDLGADAGGGDPFFARIDAPEREGTYRVEVGGETVKQFSIGPAGAAVDDPGNLSFGWNGTIINAERDGAGVTQEDYDPDERRSPASADEDVVAGAGAAEALQAGVPVEDLSGVGPISESEGQEIAERVDGPQPEQTTSTTITDPSDLADADDNREVRERLASEVEGVSAGELDIVATGGGYEVVGPGGGTISSLGRGGGLPGVQPTDAGFEASRSGGDGSTGGAGGSPGEVRAEVTRFGQRQLDAQRGPTDGDVRASVNRFGQRQLEQTNPSEQFGDVPISNPFTTGGTADGQPSTLAPGAALATDPLVGDPGDDPRIEGQLNAAGDDVRGFLAGAAEASSQGVPAGGGAFGTLSGIARVEQASRLLASELGYDVEQTDEGRFEEAAERGVVNAADVFNPPAAAAEGKEIAEFAFTQPPRILDSLAAAGEGAQGASTDRPLSVSPSAALATDPPVDEGEGAFDAAATTPFVQDVEQRGERVVATAVEEFSSNPLGATAAAAGGLAGSAAFGAGAGRLATNLPGISGTDLSGRALQGAGRVAADAELPDVRGRLTRFASDERGQGDLTFGGESGEQTISSDDLITERALAEPEGEGRLASPPDDVSGGARDRQAAGLNEQGAFVGSNTNRQDAAFGGTGKPDTGMDFSNVEFRELDRLRDRAEQRSVDVDDAAPPGIDATTAAAGAGITVPGLFGTPTEAARATQSGGFLGADDLVDSTAAVGPDVGVGADINAGQFTDARAGSLSDGRQDSGLDVRQDNRFDQFQQPETRFDEGFRFDTRLDTRVDSRVDTRQDTRYDLQQDSRFDTRFDTSTDTRIDTRFDTRIDIPGGRPEPDRDQFDPVGAAGTAPQRFENAIETPGDFLGLGEFRGPGRDEEELEEIDATGGGFGGFGGGFQGFDGGEQGDDVEIDASGGLF